MESTEKEEYPNVTFAYYVDDNNDGNYKWKGWYGGTFGPISDVPKVYTGTPSQIETIIKNFTSKLNRINTSTGKEYMEGVVDTIGAIGGLYYSSEEILRGKNVCLRTVECPIYDGPNPEFNLQDYIDFSSRKREKLTQLGVFNLPPGSAERDEAMNKFKQDYPEFDKYPISNWIYADYNLVKEWAKQEPVSFIGTIDYNIPPNVE